MFPGVLKLRTALAHLNLGGNYIEPVVGGKLRGSWCGQDFKYQTKVPYEKSKGDLVLQILVNKKSW
jgi:hypothetical protein